MSSIRAKNTQPEITIRKALWAKGRRYRLHDKSVFGTPDIVMRNRKIAIFIDGCFWHGCKKCYKEPRTNSEFWRKKIAANKARRVSVLQKLGEEGWKTLEIWEHEISQQPAKITNKILRIL